MRSPRKIPILTDADKLRFLEKVNKTSNIEECWEWKGYKGDQSGLRGSFWLNKTNYTNSRIAFFIATGVDPLNLVVCHKCDNNNCCNPNHLWIGTQNDNMQDMIRKGRDRKGVGKRKFSPLMAGNNCAKSKLKEEDVLKIRQMSSLGYTQSDMAKQFNLDQSAISNIVTRKNWKHI